MNRLNQMCDLEEKWAVACLEAGRCFSFRDEYHKIRNAIRYNTKESAFYGRLKKTRNDIEKGLAQIIQKWYPNITDWKLTVGEGKE